MKSGTCSGSIAVDLAHLVRPDLVGPLLARLLQQDRHVLGRALEHVAVAR